MKHRRHERAHKTLPTSVVLAGPSASTRRQAERFVWEAFHAAHAADIVHFMPGLLTLRDERGDLQAVLGLREPGDTPMFLEQYLDRPVQQLVGEHSGETVDRQRLVEVGNFAVGSAGGGRWLITALTAFLYSAGKSWAVFTCGPQLRNAFARLGIPMLDLSPADPLRLSDSERARWGSYYAQQPRVMAANVALAHGVLTEWLANELTLHALWHSALRAGRIAA